MFFGQSENWRRFGQPGPAPMQPPPRAQSNAARAIENTFGRSPIEHGTAPPQPELEIYTVEVTNPDGSREELDIEGPAGMSDSDIQQLLAGQMGGQPQQPQRSGLLPPPPIDTNDIPFLGGLSPNTVFGMAQGAAPVLNNAAELAQDAWNATGGRLTGLTSNSATEANTGRRGGIAGLIMPEGQRGGFEGLTRYLPQGSELGRVGGEIGATMALTRGLGGPVAQGAGAGLLMSEGDTWAERGRDAVVGGITGKAADLAVRGAARLINPVVSEAARRLHGQGVRMTPGQVIPELRRAEERLTSRPFVGGQIVRGRQQSYVDMNHAALEDVVAPYNAAPRSAAPVRIPNREAGRANIRSVGDQLSNRYNQIVPRLQMRPDAQLQNDITAVAAATRNGDMTPAAADQFDTIMTRQIAPFLNGRNPLTGQQYRAVEQRLERLVSRFGRNDAPDSQAMAESFRDVQFAFRQTLERSNPQFADELAALNNSWARLVRVESASRMAGAHGGLYSPQMLQAAVRRSDDSVRGRAFSRGEALGQQFSDDADEILPNQYPDSGTAGRSQIGLLDPRFYYGLGQGLMYGPRTQQTITNAFMTPRPQFAPEVADALRSLPAAQTGALGGLGLVGPFFGGVPY